MMPGVEIAFSPRAILSVRPVNHPVSVTVFFSLVKIIASLW